MHRGRKKRGERGGRLLSAVFPAAFSAVRQITAQKHAGEDGRGDVDEIKIQSRARRAEYGACAHAEDKAGTCIVAKAQQTLGFFAPERTGGK